LTELSNIAPEIIISVEIAEIAADNFMTTARKLSCELGANETISACNQNPLRIQTASLTSAWLIASMGRTSPWRYKCCAENIGPTYRVVNPYPNPRRVAEIQVKPR